MASLYLMTITVHHYIMNELYTIDEKSNCMHDPTINQFLSLYACLSTYTKIFLLNVITTGNEELLTVI